MVTHDRSQTTVFSHIVCNRASPPILPVLESSQTDASSASESSLHHSCCLLSGQRPLPIDAAPRRSAKAAEHQPHSGRAAVHLGRGPARRVPHTRPAPRQFQHKPQSTGWCEAARTAFEGSSRLVFSAGFVGGGERIRSTPTPRTVANTAATAGSAEAAARSGSGGRRRRVSGRAGWRGGYLARRLGSCGNGPRAS